MNEFDLPPSCTSASFTLKNHYQKYLLAYEQKFYFGKTDSEMVKELGNQRQKRKHDPNSSKRHHYSENIESKIHTGRTNPSLTRSQHEG